MIAKHLLATVVIPTYNYAHYIGEAIESVLSSDFSLAELEIIVVDDGSTDDTEEYLKSYKDKVKYIYQKNTGKARATQVGIENAQGKYLFNLDADDLFLSHKIQRVVEKFEQDPELTHISHPAFYWTVTDDRKIIESVPEEIREKKLNGKELLNYFYPRRMLFGGGSTFAARTDILKNNPIPQSVDMFIDEYLVLIALNQGYTYFFNEPLSIWRMHGKNFSDYYINPELYRIKSQRSLASMKAVLDNLVSQEFASPIPEIYDLKVQVAKVALQQDLGEYSPKDIVSIWQKFFYHLPVYRQDALTILKNYTLLNRTLPPTLLKLLKQAKRTITNGAEN